MNLPCDCKTLAFILGLALFLVILFLILIFRMRKQNKEDCGCDNTD